MTPFALVSAPYACLVRSSSDLLLVVGPTAQFKVPEGGSSERGRVSSTREQERAGVSNGRG